MWGRRTRTLTLALLAIALFGRVAVAQDVEAQRRSLIAQAERARDAGDHARAFELATRAAGLRMTPSLRLLLAQEEEQLGHRGDALDHARRCTIEAADDTTLRNRDRIMRLCAALTRDLEGRVEAPRVPDSAATATTTSASTEPAVVAPAPSPVQLEVAPRQAHSAPGAGPWIVAGLGAVALGAAGVLWALHDGAISERDAACDARGCYPSSLDANERAQGLTTATNVSLAVGGAALAAGVTWFLIARTRRGETTAARPIAWVTPVVGNATNGVGVLVGGSL